MSLGTGADANRGMLHRPRVGGDLGDAVVAYLDDCGVLEPPEMLIAVPVILRSLGITVNQAKSDFMPRVHFSFLGFAVSSLCSRRRNPSWRRRCGGHQG